MDKFYEILWFDLKYRLKKASRVAHAYNKKEFHMVELMMLDFNLPEKDRDLSYVSHEIRIESY